MNANSSTANQWLKTATDQLLAAEVETARLDALVLLSDVTGKDRTHLLAHPELELTNEQENTFKTILSRREQHEPLAYIRGKVEFYGREFEVGKYVLVPRPESESMLELLSEYGDIPTIIDVGTGSGALAISAALARPNSQVYAVDIDPECLKVARQNAKKHDVSVQLIEGDLLRGLAINELASPIVILANLPYVPDDYSINTAASHEPKLALFGGRDGLDLYRIMFDQLREYEDTEIIVFTESLESQHQALLGIAIDHGFVPGKTIGLIQTFTYLPR
jgi:release factor glutamine methyltransferase